MGALAFQMAPPLLNATLVITALALTGTGRELRLHSRGVDWAVLLVIALVPAAEGTPAANMVVGTVRCSHLPPEGVDQS